MNYVRPLIALVVAIVAFFGLFDGFMDFVWAIALVGSAYYLKEFVSELASESRTNAIDTW
jgi:hypothetical protein